MKRKLNPPGPGALSDAHELTASSIYDSVKGEMRDSACSGFKVLKLRFSKVGLDGNFSVKMALKWVMAAFCIWLGFFRIDPFTVMDSMELCFFLLKQ